MSDDTFVRNDVYEANRAQDREQVANLAARFDDFKAASSKQDSRLSTQITIIAAFFAAMQIGLALLLWFLSQPVK